MLERFINKTAFESQEDFIKNFKIKVPENFNFGYDVVDAWAEEEPDKIALCWTNDQGEHIDFTFADLKKYTDQTAAYFQSLGIGHGVWRSFRALRKTCSSTYGMANVSCGKDSNYRFGRYFKLERCRGVHVSWG